jgi:hypothetical protein
VAVRRENKVLELRVETNGGQESQFLTTTCVHVFVDSNFLLTMLRFGIFFRARLRF